MPCTHNRLGSEGAPTKAATQAHRSDTTGCGAYPRVLRPVESRTRRDLRTLGYQTRPRWGRRATPKLPTIAGNPRAHTTGHCEADLSRVFRSLGRSSRRPEPAKGHNRTRALMDIGYRSMVTGYCFSSPRPAPTSTVTTTCVPQISHPKVNLPAGRSRSRRLRGSSIVRTYPSPQTLQIRPRFLQFPGPSALSPAGRPPFRT